MTVPSAASSAAADFKSVRSRLSPSPLKERKLTCVIGARVGEDKLIHLSLVINADASDRQEQYAEANQHTDGAAWGIHELPDAISAPCIA